MVIWIFRLKDSRLRPLKDIFEKNNTFGTGQKEVIYTKYVLYVYMYIYKLIYQYQVICILYAYKHTVTCMYLHICMYMYT